MDRISIQGILFDEKSSFQKGPRLAPPLIRSTLHSGAMNLFSENGVSIESNLIEDKGDFKNMTAFLAVKMMKEILVKMM